VAPLNKLLEAAQDDVTGGGGALALMESFFSFLVDTLLVGGGQGLEEWRLHPWHLRKLAMVLSCTFTFYLTQR